MDKLSLSQFCAISKDARKAVAKSVWKAARESVTTLTIESYALAVGLTRSKTFYSLAVHATTRSPLPAIQGRRPVSARFATNLRVLGKTACRGNQ